MPQKKYLVNYTKTIETDFTVWADSESEAKNKAEIMIRTGQVPVPVDSEDYVVEETE